jgi:hypothetical protein
MAATSFSNSRRAFLGEVNSLGETLNDASKADLVDDFGKLASTRRSEQIATAHIGRHHFRSSGKRLGITTAHVSEGPFSAPISLPDRASMKSNPIASLQLFSGPRDRKAHDPKAQEPCVRHNASLRYCSL